MEEKLISMSQRDRDVLKVMSLVSGKQRTQKEAARLLSLDVRQIRRIAKRIKDEGDAGVIHRLRGRQSNARVDDAAHAEVIRLYRQKYLGFGPMLASEKLAELVIELILAGSPQAKGRIEHLWGTAQDRLVKELRLADAKTLKEANAVLEKFVAWFNRRCANLPGSANDAHCPLGPGYDLIAQAVARSQDKKSRRPGCQTNRADYGTTDHRPLGSHSCGALSCRWQQRH